MADKITIVEAVAVSAGRGTATKKSNFAKLLEQRMAEVIQDCYDKGMAGNPNAIRARMMEAREILRQQFESEE